MSEPEPGQVWADNDPRSAGRTLRVERIEDGKAICTVLTNSDECQQHLDGGGTESRRSWYKDTRGKTTRIPLPRFRPTSSRYRLVKDHD